MTEPALCRVGRSEPLDPATAAHPLATARGVELLSRLLAADAIYRPLTPRSRTALGSAIRRALAGARDGDVIPLPSVPDDTHPHTVRALARRGLVVDGRLTPLAVEVVQLAEPLHRKQRPIETVRPTGDLL